MTGAAEKRREFACHMCQDLGLVYPPKPDGLFARFTGGKLHLAPPPARPLPHPCMCAAGELEREVEERVGKLRRALGHKGGEAVEIFRFRQAKG